MKKEDYIWKNKRTVDANGKSVQTEVKLITMSAAELCMCHQHAKEMLYNTEGEKGRVHVITLINEQIDKCGAELAVRWFEQINNGTAYNRFTLSEQLVYKLKESNLTISVLKDVYDGLPLEYANLPIMYILDACNNKLGRIDKKHITLSSIYRQGLWFTREELTEFKELNEDKFDVIKRRLELGANANLFISDSGLTYSQFRSMIHFKKNSKSKQKYNRFIDLTSDQLTTLRYKLLPSIRTKVEKEVKQWERIISEIKEVAEYKNISL